MTIDRSLGPGITPYSLRTTTVRLRAWDSLFTMKSGVREVVGSIPNRANILGVFHPARITGDVFSANKSLYFKL